jgi:hypothetical protein
MDIEPHLTLRGTLKRNSPSQAASGAFADAYAAVKTGVKCRIGQPPRSRALIGGQDVSDQDPVIMFLPDEDVRIDDLIEITSGEPSYYVGSAWDIRVEPVVPSVPVYKSATARRIVTAAS